MPRLRLYDMRLSRLCTAIGVCQSDVVGIAQICNAAELRLVTAEEAGEHGWFGSTAEVLFTVSRTDPNITVPRNIARLTELDVCRRPVQIQNPIFEYLRFGIGRQPSNNRSLRGCLPMQAYDRGVKFTQVDMPPNTTIRVYPTSGMDAGKRTLLQGLDSTGGPIFTQDGYNLVQGIFVSPLVPYVDCPLKFSKLTGIQKDSTSGNFQYFAVDANGKETELVTMLPYETVASYRRYYIDGLPTSCCGETSTTTTGLIPVTAMAKFEISPVVVDTDYFLIQNSEALIEECMAIRLGQSDDPKDKASARAHHKTAISLLQGELVHYYGKQQPAIAYAPLGSARLEKSHVKINMR